MIKPPTNLLFANTATRNSTSAPLQRTRKVRSRVSSDTRKIGIFDVSARAGLLSELLETISRRQPAFTFYPIESPVPMGLGIIGKAEIAELQSSLPATDLSDLQDNIKAEDFSNLFEQTRRSVDVDIIAGLFGPMLAFYPDEGDRLALSWNYFSIPAGENVAISAFGLRDYAKRAGRPFEAAVAILILAQVWRAFYDVGFHHETRGCVYDFCEERSDLIGVIKHVRLCAQSLDQIPERDRESVEKCLQTIRDYRR